MGSRRSAAADAVEERRAGAGTPLADASHRGLASWTGPGGRLGRGWRGKSARSSAKRFRIACSEVFFYAWV